MFPKHVSGRIIVLSVMTAIVLTCFIYKDGYAQADFSEAPVEFRDGRKFSNMVYVKFNDKVIDAPAGTKIVRISNIENRYTEVADFLINLSTEYGRFKIFKAVPRTEWGKNTVIHRITRKPVQLKDMSQLFILGFDDMVPVLEIIDELNQLAVVEYAHGPVQARSLAEPNDDYYTNGGQWYLSKIEASKAWDITKGSPDIKVAVIEAQGVKRDHPDFYDEYTVSKFIEDKGDFTYNIEDPHGTQVAGIIGAGTNNGIYMIKQTFFCKLVRISDYAY